MKYEPRGAILCRDRSFMELAILASFTQKKDDGCLSFRLCARHTKHYTTKSVVTDTGVYENTLNIQGTSKTCSQLWTGGSQLTTISPALNDVVRFGQGRMAR